MSNNPSYLCPYTLHSTWVVTINLSLFCKVHLMIKLAKANAVLCITFFNEKYDSGIHRVAK